MISSSRQNIVERSYQLAKAGLYRGTLEVRQQLFAEGFTRGEIAAHLAGPTLKKTLSNLCREAQGKPKRAPPGRYAHTRE